MSLRLSKAAGAYQETPVHRVSAALKLALALGLILTTLLVFPTERGWFLLVGGFLAAVAIVGRVRLRYLVGRLVLLAPFVLGVVAVNAWNAVDREPWFWLAARSSLSLVTLTLLACTTPFSEVLRVLERLRVPALFVTTLTLMHRYLFVLASEMQRMSRARSSRTFIHRRRWTWPVIATVAAQLFVRASRRAERIYASMCARGFR